MRNTISVSRTEYARLQNIAKRYEFLRRVVVEDFFEEPQKEDIEETIEEFRKTGLYREEFLQSLAQSLKESQAGQVYKLESLGELEV